MAKVAKAVVGGVLVIAGTFIPGAQALIPLGYSLVVSNALDVIASSLADKPRMRATGQDVEYSGTVEPGWIVYGRQKVSGMNVIPPWTSGTRNQDLHQIIALAAHQVNSIPSVFFGTEEISSMGSVAGTNDDGAVTTGDFADVAWIRRYLGTTTQTSDYILNTAFTEWTSNHRLRGTAYLALRYRLDEEKYKHGKPEVSAIVLGKELYDPRLDATPGGSPTDSDYIEYSTNPALCVADYLLNFMCGYGEVSTRIDWDSVSVAANICDEDVVVPPSASPANTQKRYTCNVRLKMPEPDPEGRGSQDDLENLRVLASAMMGHVVYRGGKWRIHAGAASTSNFTLTQDDLVDGKFTLRTEVPDNEKYNRVPGQFVDADRDYQLVPFEPATNTDYEEDDGGGTAKPLDKEVLFLACDNQYEAQRNARIVLERSRLREQITGTWHMAAFKIRPWDVGTITIDELGWDEQPVRCIAWSFNQEGTIDATFLMEDEDDWNDPAIGDYEVPSIATPPGVFDPTPDPLVGFSVTGFADRIVANAEIPPSFVPGDRYNLYEYTSNTPFSSATKVVSQSTSQRIEHPRTTMTTRYYWMTVVRFPFLEESEEMPQGNGVPGAPTSVSSGYRLTVNRSTHLKILIGTASGTTTNTSTATAIDEVGASTFAWTRIDGSTKISAAAPSAATTGFSAVTFADGEQQQATFRCTGTSAGASPGTNTVDVVVTFKRDDSFLS